MDSHIGELIEISGFYGNRKEFVIAGGGNTSYKDDLYLYIKASGISLSSIDESGFCVLDRSRLAGLEDMELSSDPAVRESEVKNVLLNCRVNPESELRPSVETSLHNLFRYRFVVHTHPTVVNALLCSRDAAAETARLFGDKVLYIPYADPGFVLFTVIREKILAYRRIYGRDPQVVFIQNHGVFVAADSVDEIKGIYTGIVSSIKARFTAVPDIKPETVSAVLSEVLPAVRMSWSGERLHLARAFSNSLVRTFAADEASFNRIAKPFTPDQMVYCLPDLLYIENNSTPEDIIREIMEKSALLKETRGFLPKVIFVRDAGVIVIDDSAIALEYLHDLVLDFCQIASLAENFGGAHPMTPEQIAFIESWEVENYRKKVSLGSTSRGRLGNKIVVITGAAQGFGAAIAEMLFEEGAVVVVADLNGEKGAVCAELINSRHRKNRAAFIRVDVADPDSVSQMVTQCVLLFGGIDVMLSNAGILRAGGLNEMTPDMFDRMTRINYNGYFYCAKYASAVMKIQHAYRPEHFMDIIQINSKSGLKGSNKNFAYSGGKFGGIGLTQSFALELIPYRIKVNSICPGNYFDGPLWSDPENGLFVQYLRTGKIPGAQTLEDVRRHYESQVPAGRGCNPSDVVRAILYVIEQEYETGQAVPVTGGQEMLR